MKVLANGTWTDGFLDYHRGAGECRVRAIAWRTLERVDGLYFVRPKSVRLVYNYLREVGGREVLRKVVSRTEERLRNDKYVSCGFGQVMEHGSGGKVAAGQYVVFLAPNHPACVERIVLPPALLLPAPADLLPTTRHDALLHSDEPISPDTAAWWQSLAGWSPYSGVALPPEEVAGMLEESLRLLGTTDWSAARRLPIDPVAPARERTDVSSRQSERGRKSAVLVGYGNYAKTVILPNVRRYLDVECVHEIDPTQIPHDSSRTWSWDTAPAPREGASYDTWLIAGYHHTHAPLAVKALRAGSYAVVEKPLATDQRQLDVLVQAVRDSSRLFAGFHKRYSSMNDWARADLRLEPRDAVSYHCVVYEVPLPSRHWYRWPTARSRIVSNGCHWIDHFLFLNGYSAVEALDVQRARNGAVSCFVTLDNGACFTMVLTDQGAGRVGVQEHIELRANGATVRMVDGSSYRAEDSRRIVRRARVHKYSGFARMYQAIGRAILNGERGDSVASVASSTQLLLDLESRVQSLHA